MVGGTAGQRSGLWHSVATVALVATAATATARTFDDCAAQLKVDSQGRAAARCFYDVAVATAQWSTAARRLQSAGRRQPASGWVSYYLGAITARTSYPASLPYYRSALGDFAARADTSGEAETRIELGVALFESGDAAAAWEESRLALDAARNSRDAPVIARALFYQSWLSLQSGERLTEAMRALREAATLVFPDGPYEMRIRVLTGLGNVSFALGRYEHAAAQFAAAGDLARDRNDAENLVLNRFNALVTRRSQMEALPDVSRRGEFLEAAREVLALADASTEPRHQANARRSVGDLLATSNTPDAAESHYRAALVYSRQAGDPGDLSTSLWVLGRHLANSRPVEARHLLDEALRLAVDSRRPSLVAYAWRQQMRFAWKTLDRGRATIESRRALDAIEAIRELQGVASARAGVFSAWTLDYYWLMGTVLAGSTPSRSDVAFAFEVSERMRARLLLDALVQQPPAPSQELAARRQRRQDFLRALSNVQRRLLDPRVDDASRATLVADLERLEGEEESVRAETIARGGPSDATPAFAPLEQVEQALAPNEAVLSYSVGVGENFYGEFGGGAALLVISRAGTRVVRLPDRVRLQAVVSVFRGLTEHAEQIDPRSSARLYEMVLGNAVTGLPRSVTRLIIVPDGPLHHLPFAVLRPAPGTPTLGETHQISVVPSMNVWLRLRQQREQVASTGALVVADPSLPAAIRTDQAANERGWWPGALRLGPLPFARNEGRAILTHVGGTGHLLMGNEASETAFKSIDPRSYRVVHFAAHSLVDEEHPDRSAIFLAGGPDDEDGLLQAREIADLRLSGHIVVLSACRSATGTVLSGEGVMGLSRAFLEAGAATVVGTLWNIRDDHAAQFFDYFYESLSRGRTVGVALEDARRTAIAAGMPAFAWASVVAIGNDAAAVEAMPRRWRLWPVAIPLLACLALLVRLLLRNSRRAQRALR